MPPRYPTSNVLAAIAAEPTRAWWSPVAAWFVPEGQPSWARATAVGVALAVAIAGGAIYSGHEQQPEPSGFLARAPITATGAAGTQFTARQAELDELMLRHQALEQLKPLSEDPGISLVAYTTTY